jgi:hypothetical protein
MKLRDGIGKLTLPHRPSIPVEKEEAPAAQPEPVVAKTSKGRRGRKPKKAPKPEED